MGQLQGLNIRLYSGYTPRATALMERVEKACDENSTVELVETLQPIDTPEGEAGSSSVIILDLPNLRQSAVRTIGLVKENNRSSKILAIHIYTTKLLVTPLLNAGVDGYLPYEPSTDEICTAILTVLDSKTYLPEQISL